jgi:hypothetical protein
MLVFAPLSGRIIGYRSSRGPLIAAGCALLASPLLLVELAPHTSVGLLLASYLLFGIGSGLVNPPITNTAVSGMPPAQAGVAAAIASTSRQGGQTRGIAIIGAVAGAGASASFGPSFATATHPGWWIIAGLGGAVLVLGVLSTTRWALDTAHATAARLQPESAPGALRRRAEPEPAPAA